MIVTFRPQPNKKLPSITWESKRKLELPTNMGSTDPLAQIRVLTLLFAWVLKLDFIISPNNSKVLFTRGKIMSKVGQGKID
jgi:hypothetical protein